MRFSESLCISYHEVYWDLSIFRYSTFVCSNTPLRTTELLSTPKIIKFSMFSRKTSLLAIYFFCVKFCAENGAGVKIWQIRSMVALSKEDSGLAMGRRVHMFGRTISSLGIVSGAHWENCAELKRFGIFRRIGRNAPEKCDARHHCHRPKSFLHFFNFLPQKPNNFWLNFLFPYGGKDFFTKFSQGLCSWLFTESHVKWRVVKESLAKISESLK